MPTSALYSCIPTGMHGPTSIFWANLTPFLPFTLQVDQPFIYSIPEAFFFMIATFTCIGFGERSMAACRLYC